MRLLELRCSGFRNLEAETVRFGPSVTLVVGANGQCKTNLLEAVTVLGNLRSFRTPSMRRVVRYGEPVFSLEGKVESGAGPTRLHQEVHPGPPVRRSLKIGGAAVSVAQYLRVFPVFALSGADRELVTGGPGERRRFVDRFVFLLDHEHFNEIRQYRKILQQRNAALVGTASDPEMELWERQLAVAAAAVVHRREARCHQLDEAFKAVYEGLRGDGFPDVELHYRGESGFEQAEKVGKLEEYYRKRYNETRPRDRRNGFTGDGPHRHDLGLRGNGRTLRHTLSSGQTKVVAAALRLASLREVERQRNEHLPVIIDDVDAELDDVVLGRLIDHLSGERQLFLSSADETVTEGMNTASSRIEIHRGAVVETTGERLDERSLDS